MQARENLETGVVLIAAGVAAWLLYQVFQTVKVPVKALTAAGDAATSAIANLFPGTSPTVIPQGSVSLPSGAVVPVSSLTSQGFQSDGTLTMTDASGTAYTVQSGDTPGSYVATTPINGLGSIRRRGLR